jgi:recombination protein RecT
MANAVSKTEQQTTPAARLVSMIEGRTDDIKQMLAPGVRVDAFIRTVKNALIKDPKIAEADQQSVFLECQKAAQDGLVLDGREAVLTRFNTKKRWKEDGSWREKWVTEVTYIPMTYGIMKRVMNSGLVRSWHVGVVYSKEYEEGRFTYYAGDNPRIEHEPIIIGDRGDVVAIYSSVRLTDGTYHHDVMSTEDINRIMERTKSRRTPKQGQDKGDIVGPWASDWVEMGKKTVVRRHSKRLPMSSEDMRMVERIDALYDFEKDGDAYSDPGPRPKAVANKSRTSAAQKLAPPEEGDEQVEDAAPEDDETVDPETGEIQSGDRVIDGQILDPEDDF